MDKMARLNRLIDFWNWLPFFRAVAETEHLTEAAEIVHKSPSAVSRAINLLEEDIGKELFDRKGRNIQLNERGELFLQILRNAMRQVDEGLQRVSGESELGRVILSAPDYFSLLVSRTLDAAYGEEQQLAVEFRPPPSQNSNEQLLKGNIDILLTHDPVTGDDVTVSKVADFNNVVAAPTEVVAQSDEEWWRATAFVSWDVSNSNVAIDGWPRQRTREIDVYADKLETALKLAERHQLAVSLPELSFRRFDLEAFEQLEAEFLSDTPLFVVRRQRVVERDQADAVINLLEEQAAELTG
jgi:DNA-binding transcriptional LysR family regulator